MIRDGVREGEGRRTEGARKESSLLSYKHLAAHNRCCCRHGTVQVDHALARLGSLAARTCARARPQRPAF